MPAPESIVGHEEDENAGPYDAAPVHIARRRARSSREELEYPEHREKAQCNDVNRIASFAKVEARSWEGFSAKSLVEDTWELLVRVLDVDSNHNQDIHAMQIM